MEGMNKVLCKKILATTTVLLCALPFAWANTSENTSVNKMEVNVQDGLKIRGTVFDKDGKPVVGAAVQEKGTSNYAITDGSGRFSIDSKAGSKLIVSCIGFKEIEITASQDMKITLKEDAELLSEVVVVGYGKQKKSSLTGSVASVNVDETLDSRPIADVGRGLQGAVAGLNINIPTGEVGSDPIMKIRGQVGSIDGSSAPLILLDNVEIPSITMINPDDIKSITVLKDAAAASIYGSKAAFGVILITTKAAEKNDKVQVTYSTNFSWQNPAKKIEIGGLESIRYIVDAAKNRKATLPIGTFWRFDENTYEKAKAWQEKYGDTVKWNDPVVYGRDWSWDGTNKLGYRLYDGAKAMIKEWTPTQTHNLSVNGVSGKTSYNLGLGYLDQTGMSRAAKVDDFKRYNASIGFNSKINKWLTVRVSSLYSDRNKRYPGVGTTSDPWLYVYRWSALFPIGVKEGITGENINEPVYEMGNANTDNLRNQYFNVNVGATIDFTKDWDLQIDYTYDSNHMEKNEAWVTRHAGNSWYSPTPMLDAEGNQIYVNEDGEIVEEGGTPAYKFPVSTYGSGHNGDITATRSHTENKTLNAYTTYNLLLGANKQHAMKFMAGMNMVQTRYNMLWGKKNDLLDQKNPQFPLAIGDQFSNANNTWSSRLGFFGRFNYSFDNRYFIEANIRRDGSSKFPSHLRWKWFPSVSAGWVFTNEKFMQSIQDILSFGKLRASWGSIGDQTIPAELYISKLPGGQQSWLDSNGNKTNWYGAPTLVNPDITWQMINTMDFGIDLRFFKNQLGIVFDWYQRDTKNMILPGDALPNTLGVSAPKGNYGNLRTNGWELTVDFNHRFQNGFGINTSFAISDATSVTTKGADWQTPWENRSIYNGFSTGRRYGDIYGYVTDRLYQAEDFVWDGDEIEKITVIYKGTPRTTHRQTAEYPIYQTEFENSDKLICGPGDVKFVDVNGDGYINPGHKTNGDHGDLVVIGNSTPRYEYSFKLGLDWKGFDFSMLLQGIGKRKIWGAGQLAIPGFQLGGGCIPKTFTKDYWTPERTDAFYPKAWDLGDSNTGFTYQVQSKYLLNMAYLRLKNVTIGYSVPAKLLSKIHMSKVRVYVSLENFLTFDHLRGLPIDPEAISGYSMHRHSGYNLGRTGTGSPMFKTASFGAQISF